jgi:Antitoxin SocA-like, Panacea domain
MTAVNQPSCDEGKDILINLIDYFASTVPHLQDVKLNKLIYIAHLYHYAEHGKLLTKTRFFSLGYGPHAPAIRSALKNRLDGNAVYLEESRTSTDPVYSNPCLIIKSSRQSQRYLPRAYVNTIEDVVENWSEKDFQWILDYTTRTLPYLATTYREHIDFRTIEPSPALRQVLPLRQRVWLHRFVKTPEDVQNERYNYGDPGMLSASEVGEIYLALCGDIPDKIPDKNHLGFNTRAVAKAIHPTKNGMPDSVEESSTDIDRAARLAHTIIDSMSFKTYSGRVAFKSGLLFLKKNGYHFNGDVLEKSWPQNCFYNTLREWFQAISTPVAPGNNHTGMKKPLTVND